MSGAAPREVLEYVQSCYRDGHGLFGGEEIERPDRREAQGEGE